MTDLADPQRARVFVVGRNQRTSVPAAALSHEEYLDALFHRRGRSCRGLYDDVRAAAGRGASPTRRNTDRLVQELHACGGDSVLETNVVCYSTPMSADLRRPSHAAGAARGTLIFRALLEAIRPQVLISHGAGTVKDLGHVLGQQLPAPPTEPTRRRSNAK